MKAEGLEVAGGFCAKIRLVKCKDFTASIAYRIKPNNQYSRFQHERNDLLAAHFQL
jgi:hypothetical protein